MMKVDEKAKALFLNCTWFATDEEVYELITDVYKIRTKIHLEYTHEVMNEDYYWEADLIYNTTKCLNSDDAVVSPNIKDEDMFTPQEIIANSSRRYIEFEGVGSFKLHDQPLDWLFAERVCESEGGHLAVVDSRSKVTSLLDLFSRYPHIPRSSALSNQVYVGITDLRDEGVFYTSTGFPFDPRQDQAWLPDEPDDASPGEDCVTFHTTGKLRDVPCYFELPYICEKGTALVVKPYTVQNSPTDKDFVYG
uniref:C-type lectin domain-containing protein n=1 Tax=Timema cristinae TaxID=61476 RepID=A0A7R9CDM7_TIMCR|nr:unnamed protein product [Timema cristinae]